MAKATRKRELATEQQEQGDDNTPATGNSPADRLQQRLEYMQWVNDLIRGQREFAMDRPNVRTVNTEIARSPAVTE